MAPGGFVNPNSGLCALDEAVFMVYGEAWTNLTRYKRGI